MRTRRLGMAVLLIAGACAAPASEVPRDVAADREAIEELNRAFDEAFNRLDADAVADLFVENAVRMNQNAPALHGREAIRASFVSMFSEIDALVSENQLSEIHFSDDLATARGTWTETISPADGSEPYEDRGSWVALSQRQSDGSFKVVWNIWTTELPPRPPPGS